MRNTHVENEAVAVRDGRLYAIVYATRRGFVDDTTLVAIELESVGVLFGLLASADDLHDGKELLIVIVFLLFLEHKHEMVPEARLHHYPIDGAIQSYIGRQKHNVFALQRCYSFVLLE